MAVAQRWAGLDVPWDTLQFYDSVTSAGLQQDILYILLQLRSLVDSAASS